MILGEMSSQFGEDCPCSFEATQKFGRSHEDQRFWIFHVEVSGQINLPLAEHS